MSKAPKIRYFRSEHRLPLQSKVGLFLLLAAIAALTFSFSATRERLARETKADSQAQAMDDAIDE